MGRIIRQTLAVLAATASTIPVASAELVTFDYVSDDGTVMILETTSGYQMEVKGGTSFSGDDGRVKMQAPSNVTFKAIGFDFAQINFENIDDMDDAGPRDTWIASVPGKWRDNTSLPNSTNSDGLEIFTLDADVPVSWSQDRRARLRDVGGVGDIIINTSGGENPENEAAIFRPDPAVDSFKIYMDDIDGSRGATMFFNIAGVEVEIDDSVPPEITGPTGIDTDGNGIDKATNGAFFKTVADGVTGPVLTPSANEPIEAFNLSGVDASEFTVNEQGEIAFNAVPDVNEPTDSDEDNIYSMTLEATDLGGNTTSVPVTIDVTDDGNPQTTNSVPTIASPNAESTDPFAFTVTEFETMDVERFTADKPVTWTIAGLDSDDFNIDASGQLSFGTLPEHENPVDDNTDNQYELDVTATDNDDNTTTETVIVDVAPKTPLLTGPDGPDDLTTGNTFRQEFFEENYVVDGGTRKDDSSDYNPNNRFITDDTTANDREGKYYAGKITSDVPISSWAVDSGADSTHFEITDAGLVFFDHDKDTTTDPADYENPNDANADNIYEAVFQGTDQNGETVTADFSVEIKDLIEGVLPGSETEPPTATKDEVSVDIGNDAEVSVLDNDTPLDKDASGAASDSDIDLEIKLLDGTGAQTDPYTVAGEGEWTVGANGNKVTFSPEDEFTGDPTPVQYTVTDALGRQSEPATITVDYANAPIAEDDSSAGHAADSPVTVDVTANDTGGTTPDDSTIQLKTPGGTLQASGDDLEVEGEGTWSVDTNNGEVTFTPESGFSTSPTAIEYRVSDTSGNASGPATITLGYGDKPVAADDTSRDHAIGSTAVIDVLSNDQTDAGSLDPASLALVDPSTGVATLAGDAQTLTVDGEGVWTVNSGELEFSPEDGFKADPTPVEYKIANDAGTESNTAEVAVSYTDAPTATGDSKTGQAAGTAVGFDVLNNDSVASGRLADPRSVHLRDANDNETDTLAVPGEGTWEVNPQSGEITFTPEAGFTGNPSAVDYTFADDQGNPSSPGSITLEYSAGPAATDDSVADQPSGQAATVNVLDNDDDSAESSDIQLRQPNGTLLAKGDSLQVPGEGTWSVSTNNGEVTFTPVAEFTGDPTPVEYRVADSAGNLSNLATIDVKFAPAPVVPDLTSAGNANDTDVTVDPFVAAGMTGLDRETASVKLLDGGSAVDTLSVSKKGTWSVDTSDSTDRGKITFSPVQNFTGNPTPIEYRATADNDSQTSPAAVTIGYGSGVLAADDTSTENSVGSNVVVDVLGNDQTDAGSLNPASLALVDPSTGVATLAGDAQTLTVDGEGVWTVNSGELEFSPENGFKTDPTPVEYKIANDAGTKSNAAEVTVDYTNPPTAAADEKLNQTPDAAVTFDVLSNDTVGIKPFDVSSVRLIDEANGDARVSQLTVADEGEWAVDSETGRVTFEPAENFLGPVTPLNYVVADTQGNSSSPAALTIGYDRANQYRDSDGDGVPDHIDPNPAEYDPQGFFYCADDGRILSGGSIEVSGPSGTNAAVGTRNNIRIVRDGSDGEFQWFAQEEGEFTVTYNPPTGFSVDDIGTGENEGKLDVTDLLSDNPAFIGSDEDGNSGVLKDFSPGANAYYDEFTIESGDPHVFGNNVPLTNCGISHTVEVTQPGAENNDGDTTPVRFTVSVENAPSADQTIEYTLSGAADSGGDFTDANSGSVTLPSSQTSVEIVLEVAEDDLVEGVEGITLTLDQFTEDGTTEDLSASSPATAKISDDDATEVVVRDVDLTATEKSDNNGVMAFSLGGEPTEDVTLTFAGDADCNVTPETITLTPANFGDEQTVAISAIRDQKEEHSHSCQPTVSVTSADKRFDGLDVELSAVQISDSLIDLIRDPLAKILERDLRETSAKQAALFEDIAKGARDRLADRLGTRCSAALDSATDDRPALFESDSAELADVSDPFLSALADALTQCGTDTIEVVGGEPGGNPDLGLLRAKVVVDALTDDGIDASRLVARQRTGQNDGVAFRVLAPSVATRQECGQVEPIDVDGTLQVNPERAYTDGTFGGESYDCYSGVREITRGEFSLSNDDDLGTQAFFSITGQREHMVSDDHLRGFSLGAYLSRTSVDRLADGEIDGVGVNAGLYGAKRLDQRIIWDYFFAGAVGQHEFELRFTEDLNQSINAEGDYRYHALFAGMSLSGEAQYGDALVSPRAGVTLPYASAQDADVTATVPGRREEGQVDLDEQKGMRIFAEVDFTIGNPEFETGESQAGQRLNLAPRFYCDRDIGAGTALDCGLGAEVKYRVKYGPSGTVWGLDADTETSGDVTRQSVSLFFEVPFWRDNGTFTIGSDVSGDGPAQFRSDMAIEW